MNRRDCKEAVLDIFLYVLPVYLPFYQALLVAGIGRAILLLLLTVLLMFLVANRADIGRAVAACVRALPSLYVAVRGVRMISCLGGKAVPSLGQL